MPYSQRDIVKVKAPLPDGTIATHPFLILTGENVNSHETPRNYVGVMLTHNPKRDKFSLPINADMMETYWNEPNAQIRLHIISRFSENDISQDSTKYVGRMKRADFIAIIGQIKDYTLRIE